MSIIEGLNRPVPDPEKNSPSFQEKPLPNNGTKELPVSQEGKLRGGKRWSLILPLAGVLGTATALATDHLADQFRFPQTLENNVPHRTTYSPPQRDLGIPAHVVDQVNKYLGIRTARGDSGAPSVYRNYLPFINNRAPELRSLTQPADPEAITPEECRTLTTPYPGVVITEEVTIRLIGGVVVFPDPDQATVLTTAQTSTYYQDGLYNRLKISENFFNKYLPFKFDIEILPQPLMSPLPFREIMDNLPEGGSVGSTMFSPDYLEFYRRNSGLPIKKYPAYYEIIRQGGYHNIEYPIYLLMITPNPSVSLNELWNKKVFKGGFGRFFTQTRGGGVTGIAALPWHVIDPNYYDNIRSAVEFTIFMALGAGIDTSNRDSVSYHTPPPLDRAIITRANVAGLCSP